MNGALVRTMAAALVVLAVLGGVAAAQSATPAAPATLPGPDTWGSLDAGGLTSLSGSLAALGAAGQANRLQLAQYLAANYFGAADRAGIGVFSPARPFDSTWLD